MAPKSTRLALNPRFIALTGTFFQCWTACDLLVDWAIGHFLRLSASQTHLLTVNMEFGTKARLLHQLVKRSKHNNKSDIISAIKFLQNKANRNVFAHSYMHTTDDAVLFIERKRGEFQSNVYEFSLDEYKEHVRNVTQTAALLESSLLVTKSQLKKFVFAAISLDKRSKTSP